MTNTEAAGIVVRIARFYPSWLKNAGEEETRATFRAWAGELSPLGELNDVWPLVLSCLRAHPAPWPPGIFEIRAFVLRGLEHRRLSSRAPENRPTPKERAEGEKWLGRIRETLGKKGGK